MPAESFTSWLKQQKYLIGLSVFCPLVPSLLNYFPNLVPDKIISGFFLSHGYELANILFIFITLILLTNTGLFIRNDEDKRKHLFQYVRDTFGSNSKLARCGDNDLFRRMELSIRQFYYSWMFIWILWLVMYIIKLVYSIYIFDILRVGSKNLYVTEGCKEIFRQMNLFENMLNLINSFALFFIYMVITISTVNVGSLMNDRRQMHIGVVVLILIGISCFTFDLFSMSALESEECYEMYQFGIRIFIGVIASMSLMGVFGRLNSSFLDIPQWLMMCLCLYAAIQMLYPLAYTRLYDLPNMQSNSANMPFSAILYTISFVGKVCLFFVIRWIAQRNRFLFFLINKANSMSESDEMLRRFNKIYDNRSAEELIDK